MGNGLSPIKLFLRDYQLLEKCQPVISIGHWTQQFVPKPVPGECAFDRECRKLGLATFDEQKRSDALLKWALKHCNSKFVPESLLRYWHVTVAENWWGRVHAD